MNATWSLLLLCVIQLALAYCIQAQPSVSPYSIQVTKGEYQSFEATNTRVKIYIDTHDKNFKEVLSETDLDLIDSTSGRSLSALAAEEKIQYRQESLRLQKEKGRFRHNPNMTPESDDLQIKGKMAEDTTGFTLDIYSVAVPPKNCTLLHLIGTLHYAVYSEDLVEIEFEVPNVAELAASPSDFVTSTGQTVKFRKFQNYGDRKEGEPDYYRVMIVNHKVVESGLNGELNSFNEIALTPEEAEKPQKIIVLVQVLEKKTLKLDNTISIGL